MYSLLLALGAAPLALAEDLPMDLYMLPQWVEEGARCLDGTPYGFYYRKAPKPTDDWVIEMQGGGLCITPVDCYARTGNSQGSSNYWDRQHWSGSQITSADARVSPFYDWNVVYMKYCSGDTWTGQRHSAVPFDLYFAGHHNLNATLHVLMSQFGLRQATRLVFTGRSAGGIGVFANSDWVQSLLPNTLVLAIPVSGYFFPAHVVAYEEWRVGLNMPINSPFSRYVVDVEDSFLHPRCVEAKKQEGGDTWDCWDANVAFNYTRVKTLVVENMWDSLMIESVLLMPPADFDSAFVDYFGRQMVASLDATAASNTPTPPLMLGNRDHFTGLFQPACYDHTTDLCPGARQRIGNVSLFDVMQEWVANNGTKRLFYRQDCKQYDVCKQNCLRGCG